jgi:hypothetical protein
MAISMSWVWVSLVILVMCANAVGMLLTPEGWSKWASPLRLDLAIDARVPKTWQLAHIRVAGALVLLSSIWIATALLFGR